MMYGYGGFSVDTLPAYRPDVPAWLELGGIWVTANMRGGAEYGEAWHRPACASRSRTCSTTSSRCAEQLVADGYTSPPAARDARADRTAGLLVAP